MVCIAFWQGCHISPWNQENALEASNFQLSIILNFKPLLQSLKDIFILVAQKTRLLLHAAFLKTKKLMRNTPAVIFLFRTLFKYRQ